MTVLSDSEAKKILREVWSERTTYFPVDDPAHWWVRAQPKGEGGAVRPYLHTPGTTLLKTIPDGMWVYLHGEGYADIFVVEVCQSLQNLNDKRSRYFPTLTGRLLRCRKEWLDEKIGQRPRWKVFGTFSEPPVATTSYPIRFLRCLFALRPEDYKKVRENLPPEGHEYYTKHSSLGSWTSKAFRKFLGGTRKAGHFYPSQ